MNKAYINLAIGISTLLASGMAFCGAFDTDTASTTTQVHRIGIFKISDTVYHDSMSGYNSNLFTVNLVPSDGQGYADLTVNGTPTGTLSSIGATVYKTNNPGIGVAYRLSYSVDGTTPNENYVAPYTVTITSNASTSSQGFHIGYTLIRLTEQVPDGQITELPTVTLNLHNPAGSGYKDLSYVALSGYKGQPMYSACKISTPSSITLPTLYGNTIENGAFNATDLPAIALTKCPGAQNSISYTFKAFYGVRDAANGVAKTASGSSYAKNVYIQLQNADGTPHLLNSPVVFDGYQGSGDYTLPGLKVAYFIDDAANVTAGAVKSAIEFTVTYN